MRTVLRTLRWLGLTAVLGTTACVTKPIVLGGWQILSFSAPPTGGLLVNFDFETSGDATASSFVPGGIDSILLTISGQSLANPEQQWWYNDGSSRTLALFVSNLTPGAYSVTTTLYAKDGEDIGDGFSNVDIAKGENQNLQLLMVYRLSAASASVNFNTTSPSAS